MAKIYRQGNTVIRVHTPTVSPEQRQQTLDEIQKVNWAIWDAIQGGENHQNQAG